MVGTLPVMPTDNAPKRGRPVGRTETHTIHTAIDPKIGAALVRFMQAQPFPPKLRHVVERAFVSFLSKEGFWPPPVDKKGHK